MDWVQRMNLVLVKGGNDMEYRIVENVKSAAGETYNAAETVAVNASKSANEIARISELLNVTYLGRKWYRSWSIILDCISPIHYCK